MPDIKDETEDISGLPFLSSSSYSYSYSYSS